MQTYENTSRADLIKEIQRIETALSKTDSPKLKHDYGKYLKKLQQRLKFYDKSVKSWLITKT